GSQAAAQLAGGSSGEGPRHGAPRLERPHQHAVRDAVGDGARLARAGTRDDTNRPAQRGRDVPLLRIEAGEDIGGAHAHHPDSPVRHGRKRLRVRMGPQEQPVDQPVFHHRKVRDQTWREALSGESMSSFAMYSTAWCGYCHRLKSALNREGIDFDVVDIEADPASADLVMSVNGGNAVVPTLIFSDGSALTNPSVAEVKEKLADLGAVS